MERLEKYQKLFGYGLLTLLVLYWYGKLVFNGYDAYNPPWIVLDTVNLIFHEAGHFIFMAFGQYLHVLGGSLMQLLVPFIVLIAFLKQDQRFAAGFAVFWLGESGNNLSYYISDARSQALPLLGGDPSGHDWYWLLNWSNALESDTAIGNGVHILAIVLMSIGIAVMLYQMYVLYYEE